MPKAKLITLCYSAGIVGTYCPKQWPSERSEVTTELITEYANELYNAYSFEGWEKVTRTNVAAVFFVTFAFLPLLAKGSNDGSGLQSGVVNISSIWATSKLNYGVVSIVKVLLSTQTKSGEKRSVFIRCP